MQAEYKTDIARPLHRILMLRLGRAALRGALNFLVSVLITCREWRIPIESRSYTYFQMRSMG